MMTAAASSGDSASAAAATVLIILGMVLWMVPVIVALARKVPNRGSVIVLDVFLGWTVIGWVVALAMACRSRPQQPQVVIPHGWQPPD